MQITSLHIYPIKGCRGHALSSVAIDRLGSVGDRRLMIVDGGDHFISQREVPALATIIPTLTPAVARAKAGALSVAAPKMESLHLTIDPDGPSRNVTVWGYNEIVAADQGDGAARWFSAALGTPCRLVAFGALAHNPIDSDYSPRDDAETAFTDGYPMMAALQESLDDLNTRLTEPVPMERFRPTIVISGAPAWSEDEWRGMRLGEITADSVKGCARCVVTTTDQQSGAKNPQQEPLRTLATFRTVPRLGAIFGQNLVPRNTGMLRVGDPVTLL